LTSEFGISIFLYQPCCNI